MKIVYMFFFIYLLFFNHSHSRCNGRSGYEFLDSSDKKVHGAMLGTISRTSDKVIFMPILCMNAERCESVDLSSFPKYEHGGDMNIIWRYPMASSYFYLGKLYFLFWKENSLQDAINAQKKYAYRITQKPQVKPPPSNYFDSFCSEISDEKSSLLIYTDSKAGRNFSDINFEISNKLIYSNYSIGKMIGCGCEDYFDSSRKLRQTPKSTIYGKYIKKGEKLFFIEKQFDADSRPVWGREIEVLEGDKCNIFVNEYIGKDIQIALYEPLEIMNNSIKYINACKNPIVFD
jgi:hypothetical protein